MKHCLHLFVLALACALCACSPAQPLPSEKKDHPRLPEIPPKIDENRDAQIEIIVHHPGANHKNIYFTLHNFGDTWKDDDGKPVHPDLVRNLQIAASQALIEAEAPYGCRSVEKGRQLRIRFKHDGHAYAIMTASNCTNFAPFNVAIDGKRFVQLSGELGKALIDLLRDSAAFTAQMAHLKNGFIDFTKPLPDDVDDARHTPQTPLIAHYAQAFEQDESFKALLASRKLKEDLPELRPTLELGCNQAKTLDCDTVLGRYTIPITHGVVYPVSVQLKNNDIQAALPPNFETAKRAFEQPALRAFVEHAPRPISASWSKTQDCPVTDALAPWFHADSSPKDCTKWTFVSADKAQTLIFYPRLNAVWIDDSAQTLSSALKPLASLKALPKPTKSFIRNLEKPAKSPRNIFLDGNSSLYVFETENGRTTCTICPD